MVWELQVEKRKSHTGESQFGHRSGTVCLQLYTNTVISDARMTPVFLSGHRPVPKCSQLPLYTQEHGYCTAPPQAARFLEAVPRKKFSDIVNFLKSGGSPVPLQAPCGRTQPFRITEREEMIMQPESAWLNNTS
jgi:hypothetical protein